MTSERGFASEGRECMIIAVDVRLLHNSDWECGDRLTSACANDTPYLLFDGLVLSTLVKNLLLLGPHKNADCSRKYLKGYLR